VSEPRQEVERALRERYPPMLADFLRQEREETLARAYELGRRAVAAGVSHLFVVELHHETLAAILERGAAGPGEDARVLRRASACLAEALAPYEMALRGFAEAVGTLQRVNRELEARVGELAVALRARQDFLTIASHELRTPVAAALLQIEAVLRRAQREPALWPGWGTDRLRFVRRQVWRLERLVEQLLAGATLMGAPAPAPPPPVDLGAVVREIAAELQDCVSDAGCTLAVEAASVDGPWDVARLEMVVASLLDNALKFGAGKPVELTVSADAATAVLRLRDHGPGISAAELPWVFERFERLVLARHRSGFGLGLWIARQVVEQMGGTIRVESEPGAGAEFIVALPRAAAG
jgi:signal transduction histidine kinase